MDREKQDNKGEITYQFKLLSVDSKSKVTDPRCLDSDLIRYRKSPKDQWKLEHVKPFFLIFEREKKEKNIGTPHP